jgi:hypothetical protein
MKNSILLCLFLASVSCEPLKNNPPQITELICSKADLQVYGGEQVIFECIATDTENDRIIYNWSASSGTFNSNLSSSTIVWTSPIVNIGSIAKIMVQVTDDEHNGDNTTIPDAKICWIQLDPIPIKPNPEPEPEIITKYACDDTFVSAGNPDDNYGQETYLNSGMGYYTYLRFDIRDINKAGNSLANIDKVQIKLNVGYNNTLVKPEGKALIYGMSWTNSSWNEKIMTYNNRPEHEPNPLYEITGIRFDVNGIVRFDVKSDFLSRAQLHNYYSVMVYTISTSVEGKSCYFYPKELKNSYPEYGDIYTPELIIIYNAK